MKFRRVDRSAALRFKNFSREVFIKRDDSVCTNDVSFWKCDVQSTGTVAGKPVRLRIETGRRTVPELARLRRVLARLNALAHTRHAGWISQPPGMMPRVRTEQSQCEVWGERTEIGVRKPKARMLA